MDFIGEFMNRYAKEYDFYEKAARIAADILERDLVETGVRCIITSRAKSEVRLEAKCRQRNAATQYVSVEQIFQDIVDLAGVRVALYFPGQRQVVGKRIETLFDISKVKEFPEQSKRDGTYRFSGYSATHYLVHTRDDHLSERDKRYTAVRVEIQVASVLMHSWAEVDHDLVYKPHSGELSRQEHAVLDQLNGLVLTGEGMLESLQQAGETRIAQRERPFANHYELAAHLLGQEIIATGQPVTEAGVGRVDLLFDFLRELRIETPSQLESYLDALHGNLEARPLSEQVTDALIAEDPARYSLYRFVRRGRPITESDSGNLHEQIGRFLTSWIHLEQLEKSVRPKDLDDRKFFPTGRVLSRLGLLSPGTSRELDFLRRMRNQLVHGVELPSASDLEEGAQQIDHIVAHVMNGLSLRSDGDSSEEGLQ